MLGKAYKLCILEKNEDDKYLRFIPFTSKDTFSKLLPDTNIDAANNTEET